MEQKNNIMIDKELYGDIEDYCAINELDVAKILNKALKKGFDIEKFGLTPTSAKKLNKPVEVIKTVEKIVEKIVKVSDDTKVNGLLLNIDELSESMRKCSERLAVRDESIANLRKELKECKEDNKKDMYGE
jgi:hypothetical protein